MGCGVWATTANRIYVGFAAHKDLQSVVKVVVGYNALFLDGGEYEN